jgi:hypothetical protein
VAQWLWSLGLTLADVRARDDWAFRYACENGHLAVAQYLWSLGLNIEKAQLRYIFIHTRAYIHLAANSDWLPLLNLAHW